MKIKEISENCKTQILQKPNPSFPKPEEPQILPEDTAGAPQCPWEGGSALRDHPYTGELSRCLFPKLQTANPRYLPSSPLVEGMPQNISNCVISAVVRPQPEKMARFRGNSLPKPIINSYPYTPLTHFKQTNKQMKDPTAPQGWWCCFPFPGKPGDSMVGGSQPLRELWKPPCPRHPALLTGALSASRAINPPQDRNLETKAP